MSDYVYDPAAMEKLFAELTDEDGEFGYGLRWDSKYVKDEETGKWGYVEDSKHDCFEYDGVSFWWYHAENIKHPNTPVLVASWSVRTAIDDFKEYEETIDAEADSVHNLIRAIERTGGRLEWDE